MKKLLIGLMLFTNLVWAQSIEYPELQVEPSASWRVNYNAKKDQTKSAGYAIPLAISGLSTLTAGIFQFHNYDRADDGAKQTAWIGVSVGLVTLGSAAYIAYYNSTNADALTDIAAIPGDGTKEKLRRERVAEEALRDNAMLYRTMKYSSVVLNLAASLKMGSDSKDGSKMTTGISAVMSFLPLLFNHYWEKSYKDHKRNKKNIYRPLASVAPVQLIGQAKLGTAFNLMWQF